MEQQIQTTNQSQISNQTKIKPDNQVWCDRTEQPLWEVLPEGHIRYLAPHGRCCFCDGWFHADAIHKATTHTEPIRLIGAWCEKCYALPLPPGDPLRNIKLME